MLAVIVFLLALSSGLFGMNTARSNVRTPATQDIRVLVDGIQVQFDQPPIIQNGRILVPMRAIFEALGASVGWNENTQVVSSRRDTALLHVQVGRDYIATNTLPIPLDVPAQIIGDRVFVPIRAISEGFGADVGWYESSRTIRIASPPPRVIGGRLPLNEAVIMGVPLHQVFGMSLEDMSEAWGRPESQELGWYFYRINGGQIRGSFQRRLGAVVADARLVNVRGESLNVSRSELIRMFGDPIHEYHDFERIGPTYLMIYTANSTYVTTITFHLAGPDQNVMYITFEIG